MPCSECNMAESPFSDSFLFCLGEKKNLSPNFGVIVFFLDLVDFQSTGSWDFSSLFFFLARDP